jgi:hypothetical protein
LIDVRENQDNTPDADVAHPPGLLNFWGACKWNQKLRIAPWPLLKKREKWRTPGSVVSASKDRQNNIAHSDVGRSPVINYHDDC